MRLYEVGEANLEKRSATSFPYSHCYVSWSNEVERERSGVRKIVSKL